MASKAEIARDAVRVIITEQTAKGPKARFSIPANLDDLADVVTMRAASVRARANGNPVAVDLVTMAIV